MNKTATCKKVWLPKHRMWVHFQHRDTMRKRLVREGAAEAIGAIPAVTLPVDGTGDAGVSCPMDGNDTHGDCMEAMACHTDNIWTYGQGKPGWTESVFNQQGIINQYEAASGGDNGLDEPKLLTQCWKPGLAGQPLATYVDTADIDFTNDALLQYCQDNFYAVQMMWSVPDKFLQGFSTGTVWPNAGIPDDNNGHGTPLADVGGPQTIVNNINCNGFYRLWTWGGWAWVSPAFIKSVEPAGWVTFSKRQFNALGYDSKGRHITKQAMAWTTATGRTIPAAVINSFPGPGPTPVPPIPPVPPVPPTPPAPDYRGSLSASRTLNAGKYSFGHQTYLTLPTAIPPGIYAVGFNNSHTVEVVREPDSLD